MEVDIVFDNLASILGLVVCIFNLLPFTEGYATGAGIKACTTLRPGHGNPGSEFSSCRIEVVNETKTYTSGIPIKGMLVVCEYPNHFSNNNIQLQIK